MPYKELPTPWIVDTGSCLLNFFRKLSVSTMPGVRESESQELHASFIGGVITPCIIKKLTWHRQYYCCCGLAMSTISKQKHKSLGIKAFFGDVRDFAIKTQSAFKTLEHSVQFSIGEFGFQDISISSNLAFENLAFHPIWY